MSSAVIWAGKLGGQTTAMQELTEIDAAGEHACLAPSIERWNVFEPISGRWSWLTVYRCCRRVFKEPTGDAAPPERKGRAA